MTVNELRELEREYKYTRMDTIHKHNMQLLHENHELKGQLKQRDETIKELNRLIEEAFVAGRSQTSWKTFLSEHKNVQDYRFIELNNPEK